MPAAIIELDRDGVVLAWNRGAEALLGFAAEDVLGRTLPTSILGRSPDCLRLLERLQEESGGLVLQLRCRRRGGGLVEIECRAGLTRTPDGGPRGAALMLLDVTERHRLERKLRYQAQHDALTRLPNRDTLMARLAATLTEAETDGGRTGLLVIDLDRFREVNDALGHTYGDRLLAQIGPRLLGGAVRDNDMIARLAGDEFAVLLPELDSTEAAESIARRVLSALHQPFSLDGTTADIAASIGVAVSPDHGHHAVELLRLADIAMYQAKETSSGVVMYTPRPGRQVNTHIGLLGDLRRALDRGELVVHFQPKVDLATGDVCGAEALARWQHPTRGLLPPSEFIPMIEATGLMTQLTDDVLDSALAQVRAWRDAGHPVQVSVNLSARGLHDMALPGRVRSALDRNGVPNELLCLEITETAVMHDMASALVVLGELASTGVRLSLDDFGTGYSSMSYLQRLPVTELKIDRSFISELTADHASRVLVRSTIELGHGLNLPVVAEGVEDAATVEMLRRLGCDMAQGYHYAKPMPLSEFDAWMSSRVADEAHAALLA